MFPHTITIYNKYKDGTAEKWHRTVLKNVFWNSSKGAVIRKTGVTSIDSHQLIIPFSSARENNYAKPKAFEALDNKTGYFTLGPKDIVILGEIHYEVEKSSSELMKFDDVLTISNVDTKELGSNLDHWEVTGK